MSIQGHIGIGETPLSLRLPPANGVTIISARNGIGKTSAADAIRYAVSGGQVRGYQYELAERNIHCTRRSITVTATDGPREIQIGCSGGGPIRWCERGGTQRAMPGAWIAAF